MTDTRQFSDAIGTLYESILSPGSWPDALRKLTNFVGGSSALLFHQDHRLQSGAMVHSHNADPHWTRLYFEKYVPLNPVLPLTAFMEPGACSAFSRLIDMDEFRASQFYLEWAAPQDFLDVVVAVLDKSASAMGMFGVTRLAHEGLAGEGEIQRMELVAPHVRRAVSLARMFENLKVQSGSFSSTLNSLADAVLLVDGNARIVFANSSADQLLAASSQVANAGGALAVRDPVVGQGLRGALRALASNGLDGDRLPREFLLGKADEDRIVLYLVPLTGLRVRTVGVDGAVAAIFVRRLQPDSLPPMEILARLYNLTPRELQVFTGIIQFGGVPEVARIFGLAPTTVRTHLQSLFDKTGARRQADLAGLAASVMPPVRSPDRPDSVNKTLIYCGVLPRS